MTKKIKNYSAISLLVLLILPLFMPMTQSWSTTATTIISGSNNEIKPQIIADGGGGSIICWLESLGGSTHHVKAQRLNSRGELQWSTSGVTLAASIPYLTTSNIPKLCTDGAGGAFVVWRYGSADPYSLYIRRVSSSGALDWAQLEISNADGSHTNFDICSDEAGGVVIVWQDNREGNYNIYAQRIDGNGNKQWGENGTVVIDWTDFQVVPQVIYNGSGWFYVAWADRRSSEWDMYAQHLNSSGGHEWATAGVVICGDAAYQSLDDICSDGNGGAIISWSDSRGPNYEIYAQRIAPNGTQFWGTDGKPITSVLADQTASELCTDGAGGVFLVWLDKRNDTLGDIYGQRLNSTGHNQWTTNGIPIANEAYEQDRFEICVDGVGGAFIVWRDARSLSGHHIYLQRINESGYPLLGGNGTLVELQLDMNYPDLAYLSAGQTIMVWEGDTGDSMDIFAQIYPEQSDGGGDPIPGFILVYSFLALLVMVAVYRKRILS